MEKYTIIYVESWVSGFHRHSITKMKRIEKRTATDFEQACAVNKINLGDVIFIFHGWPKMQGE